MSYIIRFFTPGNKMFGNSTFLFESMNNHRKLFFKYISIFDTDNDAHVFNYTRISCSLIQKLLFLKKSFRHASLV